MTSYKDLDLSYASYLPAEQLLAKLEQKLPKLPDHIPAMPPSIPDNINAEIANEFDRKCDKKENVKEEEHRKEDKTFPIPLRAEQKSCEGERRYPDFIPFIDFN